MRLLSKKMITLSLALGLPLAIGSIGVDAATVATNPVTSPAVQAVSTVAAPVTNTVTAPVVHGTSLSVTGNPRKDMYVNAIAYQKSAEVAALQRQAYELATLRLDQALQHKGEYKKPLAIISDIDMTIMDDTTFQAEMMKENKAFDNGPWDGYYHALATNADQPIPGSVEFFKYAASKGVSVFYITNRDWDTLDETVAQLKHWVLPNADAAHVQVIPKGGSSDKQQRRDNVLQHYDVIMYLGDNIADFTSDFKRDYGPFKRTAMANDPQYAKKFGTQWIVFPNATYGDWLGAVWYNNKKATAEDRSAYANNILEYYRFTNPQWKIWYDGYIKDKIQ